MIQHVSTSPEQTQQIAADLALTLHGGEVIFLEGDLGSGKTTFVQGLADALGYKDPVRSPTFSIMNIYPINHPVITRLIHLDLYRLKDESELIPLAIDEYRNHETVLAVEWPNLLKRKKFDKFILISFESVELNKILHFQHYGF